MDDAHAIGVLGPAGRGTFEHFAIEPDAIDIRIGTLSKAIPSVGGFAAVTPDVALILRYSSHGTLFSAALTPVDAAAALAAVDVLAAEPALVARLANNAAFFRDLLERTRSVARRRSSPCTSEIAGGRSRWRAPCCARASSSIR